MKELKTQAGGQPITVNYFDFIQESYREGIEDGIGKWGGADGQPRLLHGLEVTQVNSNQRDISDGWVTWVGDLYRVQGGTVFGTDHLVLIPNAANIPPSKLMLDQITVIHPYTDLFLTVGSSPSLGNPFVIYMNQLIPWGTGPWHFVGAPNEPAFATGWGNYYAQLNFYELLSFRRTCGDRIELRGTVQGSQGATNTLFTLPIGYRPKFNRVFPLLDIFGGNAHLIVRPNGDVIFSGTLSSLAGAWYHLDGVAFDAQP